MHHPHRTATLWTGRRVAGVCNPRDVELLAEEFLQAHGYRDAAVTAAGPDRGSDVIGAGVAMLRFSYKSEVEPVNTAAAEPIARRNRAPRLRTREELDLLAPSNGDRSTGEEYVQQLAQHFGHEGDPLSWCPAWIRGYRGQKPGADYAAPSAFGKRSS